MIILKIGNDYAIGCPCKKHGWANYHIPQTSYRVTEALSFYSNDHAQAYGKAHGYKAFKIERI